MTKTQKAIQAIISQNITQFSDDVNILIAQTTAKLFINEVLGMIGDEVNIDEIDEMNPYFKENFRDICIIRALDIITTKHAKEILVEIWSNPFITVIDYILSSKLLEEQGGDALLAIVDAVIEANPKIVSEIKAGKDKAIGSLIGPVMKEAKGKANPQEVKKLLESRLKGG